ncbi:hypothetical protein D6C82_02613 [Aureobasidium pullulans]|nr:hypothetical protein D6C82_02613 [Aureobasidium pullulans]
MAIPALSRSDLSVNDFGRSILKPRWIFGFAVVLVTLITLFTHTTSHSVSGLVSSISSTKPASSTSSTSSKSSSSSGKAGLHYLIPATSSNRDFCKLLLSSTILDYPTPVLINWGAHEEANPYKQHLAKVETLLAYLKRLKPISKEDDLVLILDGYDVWFQLRPDVLLKRYFEMNANLDQRTIQAYGQDAFDRGDHRTTVIFGPDKICWPIDFSRPACWAVPHTGLSPTAFGPEENDERETHNEPRWLNSGTIMGPIQDMIDVFQATLDLIHYNHTTDSDQFYFANVFGDQEYARLSLDGELLENQSKERYREEFHVEEDPPRQIPEFDVGQRTEYHIGIDYFSAMFQTLAFYKQFLAWIRPSDSWATKEDENGDVTQERYGFKVAEDISKSLTPFAAFEASPPTSISNASVEYPKSWEDVSLCVNTVTDLAPVTLHFTGEKALRELWWDKLWFYEDGEELRKASLKMPDRPISEEPIAGKMWYKIESEDPEAGKGGAWADNGGWHSWTSLCKTYEDQIFPRKTIKKKGPHRRRPSLSFTYETAIFFADMDGPSSDVYLNPATIGAAERPSYQKRAPNQWAGSWTGTLIFHFLAQTQRLTLAGAWAAWLARAPLLALYTIYLGSLLPTEWINMSSQGVMSKLKRSLWQGNGPDYERVDLEDGFEKEHTNKRSSRHAKPVIITLAFLLTIFLFLTSGRKSTKPAVSLKETLPPAYLRMVYPARQADANFCKIILSGAILNYPEPMLIGFEGKNKHENTDSTLDLAERISQKTSILGIDKHLRNISATRDEDLVVIADGLNTWFQLRPQTLLDRYFESNRNADARIRKELGIMADTLKIHQTIIFGAQRDCSPWNAEDPACSAVPESSLPKDIYGPLTDVEAGEKQDRFTKHRPRYISPGFAIGPLGAMRKLYAEAAKRAMGDEHLQEGGKVLGQIFAEQEMARESHKAKPGSAFQGLSAWLSSFWESPSAVADRQAQQLKETDLSREFGIGLDYASGLAFEAAHADGDMEWVKFGDSASVHAANAKHGISDSRISNVGPDVGASLPPFWTYSHETLPSRSTPWTNVSLLTNVWTGVTPAIIQHDINNYKTDSLRESWWSNIWYQKYGRKMFDVHVQSPIGPVAISGYDAASRRQWWSAEDWKGGARNETRFWWRYEDVCGGTEQEVFRDKKGPWYLPSNH